MFVRNGHKVGSILHEDTRKEIEPAPAEPNQPTVSQRAVKAATKAELIADAQSLGLSTEGTKAELEARIERALTGEEASDGDNDLHG